MVKASGEAGGWGAGAVHRWHLVNLEVGTAGRVMD